jgi:hypothetical protein
MTTRDQIETRLLGAVAFEPSEDGLRWLDQRVAQIAARPVALPRRGFVIPRLVLRPVLVLAAFVLIAGAVAGGVGLLDQIFQSSAMPGWQTAWDRAERLDLTQTDAGVTITLERAYADLNHVLVGFTVEGLQAAPLSDHGEPAPIEWRAELRDPTGRTADQWATSGTGTSISDPNLSAVGNFWEGAVTPVAGTWVLTFTSVGFNAGGFVSGECYVGNTDPACENPPPRAMVDGTWRFEFALPAPVGTVLSPNVSQTVGDATLTLTELRITPTMITARIALRVAGGTVADWGPAIGWGPWVHSMSIRRDGTEYDRGNITSHVTVLGQDPDAQGPEGDVNEFMTNAGVDEATGTWEIEISEITYRASIYDPIEQEGIHLSGPWTLTVTVP